MADTVTEDGKTETVTTTESLKNESAAEVEAAKKRAEQAEMRANQLQNELDKRSKAEDAARQKQLEEQNEFKTLYEREKLAREELERKEQDELKRENAKKAETEIFSEFPSEVVEVATSVGLQLNGETEEAKKELRDKLTALKDKVSPKATVHANNTYETSPADPEKDKLLEGMKVGHKESASKFIGGLESIKSFKRMAGLKVD